MCVCVCVLVFVIHKQSLLCFVFCIQIHVTIRLYLEIINCKKENCF